jgi:hypothetical protein
MESSVNRMSLPSVTTSEAKEERNQLLYLDSKYCNLEYVSLKDYASKGLWLKYNLYNFSTPFDLLRGTLGVLKHCRFDCIVSTEWVLQRT